MVVWNIGKLCPNGKIVKMPFLLLLKWGRSKDVFFNFSCDKSIAYLHTFFFFSIFTQFQCCQFFSPFSVSTSSSSSSLSVHSGTMLLYKKFKNRLIFFRTNWIFSKNIFALAKHVKINLIFLIYGALYVYI